MQTRRYEHIQCPPQEDLIPHFLHTACLLYLEDAVLVGVEVVGSSLQLPVCALHAEAVVEPHPKFIHVYHTVLHTRVKRNRERERERIVVSSYCVSKFRERIDRLDNFNGRM